MCDACKASVAGLDADEIEVKAQAQFDQLVATFEEKLANGEDPKALRNSLFAILMLGSMENPLGPIMIAARGVIEVAKAHRRSGESWQATP